jgi:carbon-monoxide dehydrogenase medium subunit
MIPSSFDYRAADTVEEAAALLEEYGDAAKLLAGGQSLLPLLKLRFAAPGLVVDLGRLEELRRIQANGTVRVGAMVTHDQMGRSAVLAERFPLIADAAADIADPLVRNRGTFGGSLAHADPAGDWPAVALALGARIHATSRSGARDIPVDEFFTDVFTSALAGNEVLTHIDLPNPEPGARSAYVKIPNPASGYAVAGAAAVLTVDPSGICRSARVAVTGVASVPYRAAGTETALVGRELTPAVVRDAADAASAGIEPLSDVFAPGAYRQHLATVVTRRALLKALSSPNG